jgi:phosphopantothenoylcysteine decarboxylase/phosphopantothenate--cysteine ligase
VRFVVTAGPTREPIDPIRFLSNRSSGRMGYAIAEAAIEAGHVVTLISGPVNIAPPRGAKIVSVITSDEMCECVHQAVGDCDVLVMCAAVADYKPANYSPRKLKKSASPLSIELVPTTDILASLPQPRPFFVVGFAAETDDLESNAQKKLHAKKCDMLVANDVSRDDVGIESDENEVVIFFKNHASRTIQRAKKNSIARDLVKIILRMRENCLTKKS